MQNLCGRSYQEVHICTDLMASRTSLDWKSQKQKKQKVEPNQCNNSYKLQLTTKFSLQMIIFHFTTKNKWPASNDIKLN